MLEGERIYGVENKVAWSKGFRNGGNVGFRFIEMGGWYLSGC